MQLLAQPKGLWNICFLCFLDIAGGFSPVGVDFRTKQPGVFCQVPDSDLGTCKATTLLDDKIDGFNRIRMAPSTNHLYKTSPTLKI